MQIREHRQRRMRLESLEARLVLSCDFSGNGVCGVEDLDILYDAGSVSVTGEVFRVFQSGRPDLIVQDLFVTTDADITVIQGSLSVLWPEAAREVELYNYPGASDTSPPSPELIALMPGIEYDSWVRTPGDPVTLTGTFSELDSFGVVSDTTDTGPAERFHFARLTYQYGDQVPFRFAGDVITVAEDGTPEVNDFSIEFPNSEANRFSFDSNAAIDARDLPGWLASASVNNEGNLNYRIGDVNLDGNVDSTDLGVVLNNFSQTSSDLGWGDGDLDMSGSVDSTDLGLVLNGFGFESQANSDSINLAAEAINAFAGDLYEELQKESGNVVFSPLSISTAFGMAFAAARGQTATEIADVLHFGDGDGIHESFSDLLASYESTPEPSELQIANSIWPDLTYPIRQEYVDAVGRDYRAEAQNLNYAGDPEGSEEIINEWVAEQTNGRIQDLLEDKITADTVLVIANALYFNSLWEIPFEADSTSDQPFTTAEGVQVDAPQMYETIDDGEESAMRLGFVDGFEVLEILFRGGAASMVVMLPPRDDSTLSVEQFENINSWVDESNVGHDCLEVGLPRFDTTVSTDLEDLLPQMGMPTAFTPGSPGDPQTADFTGAFFEQKAYIEFVTHKANISVSETGAEAAAATAIVIPILCFAAGTPVMTPSGPRPIEEIKVGDYVLSRNENDPDGAVESKQVEELFQGEKPVIQFQVSGKIFRPTEQHNFFVKDRGWVAAVELQVGDLLSTVEGEWNPVESVTINPEVVPVYNFRVADFHTYFVGDKSDAVWTHNCYSPRSFVADRTFHFAIRDNINSTTIMMGRIDDPTQMENELAPGAPVESSPLEPARTVSEVNVPPPFRSAAYAALINDVGDLDTHQEDLVWNPESLEPSVEEGLSYENFIESMRQVQSQWRFVNDSVDEAIQDDSLSLDWVDSLDTLGEADEVLV